MAADYEAFEDPEEEFYGTAELPLIYTGTYQIRQFGVGGASTLGFPPNIIQGLANPPANMVAAAHNVRTSMVLTTPTKERYMAMGEEPEPEAVGETATGQKAEVRERAVPIDENDVNS